MKPRVYVAFFFFFQAEDGIRDDLVTGVQTCALPIYLVDLGVGRATRHQDRPDHALERRARRQGALCPDLDHRRRAGGRGRGAVREVITRVRSRHDSAPLEISMIALRAAKAATVAAIALFASLATLGNL